ncbi:hypothetical protein IJ096_01600, partial [Candidatus Saccharibacteria bacterium]|nr:hypothetical protein [Candidatus Saccharibacteria bacterium]
AIKDNCTSIKQTLRSVQHVDSRTRVYLGQIYQIVLVNYMTPLNLRLVKNNQPNASLATLQTNFTSARDEAAQKFITYSQSLEELLLVDCSKDPEKFYNTLTTTRQKRSELSAATTKVSKILNDHVATVTKIKDNYAKPTETN